MRNSQVQWLTILLEGVALTAVGILLFTNTDPTVNALLLLLGIWWLIGGIVRLVGLLFDHLHWVRRLLSAVLRILAGLAIVAYPTYAAAFVPAAMTRVTGVVGVFIGVVTVVAALRGAGWGTGVLGLVGIVLGLILLSIGTGPAIATAIILAGVCAIIGGISATLYALRLARSAPT